MAKYKKGDVVKIRQDLDEDFNYYMDDGESYNDYTEDMSDILGEYVTIEGVADMGYAIKGRGFFITDEMVDQSIDYYKCLVDDYSDVGSSIKKENIYPADYCIWGGAGTDTEGLAEIYPKDWEKVEMSDWIDDKAWVMPLVFSVSENGTESTGCLGNDNATGVEYTREANISYGDMNTTSVYNYEFDEDGYMYPLSASSEDRVEIEKPTLFTSEMDKINILLQQIILCKAELEELESQLEEKENEYGIKFNID
jgi:hypothetical protein